MSKNVNQMLWFIIKYQKINQNMHYAIENSKAFKLYSTMCLYFWWQNKQTILCELSIWSYKKFNPGLSVQVHVFYIKINFKFSFI